MSKKKLTLDDAVTIIYGMLNEKFPSDNEENLQVRAHISTVLANTLQGYVLCEFPESQSWMHLDDAIFCAGSEGKTGSSAYFVPIKHVV